jgi:hypothetical protein
MKAWAGEQVMSHTMLERVEQLHDYEGVATRLCSIPVFGYRWRAPDAWTKVVPGWALGFFDEGDRAGFLLVADEVDGVRRPLIADWAAARTWLLSEKWLQMKRLRAVAEMDGPASEGPARRAG